MLSLSSLASTRLISVFYARCFRTAERKERIAAARIEPSRASSMMRLIARACSSKSVVGDGEEEVSRMLGACADASRGVGVGGDIVDRNKGNSEKEK